MFSSVGFVFTSKKFPIISLFGLLDFFTMVGWNFLSAGGASRESEEVEEIPLKKKARITKKKISKEAPKQTKEPQARRDLYPMYSITK